MGCFCCGGSTSADAVPSPITTHPAGGNKESVVIVQPRELDFERVMDHKVGLAALLKFARTEFSEEQLLFWIDVKKMNTLVGELKKTRLLIGDLINN